MLRREFVRNLAFGGVALGAGPLLLSACGTKAPDEGSADSTLRIILPVPLTSLDPIWTTAPGTREYGFLTFDQLVALDSHFRPQPEMADWVIEDAGRSYVFKLRKGLKFHDNQPVRSQDCIPSIQRWAVRDGFGQLLMKHVAGFDVIDDQSFRIRLNTPFPSLPQALGKSSGPACVMMPERMAKTDPMTAVTESIGSGPFRFLKDEWISGSRAVWERFDGYVPRSGVPDGMAGGRVPRLKRIEWSHIPDASTALAALQAGEQDFWNLPEADLLPVLRADPNITVASRLSVDAYFMLQPNHQQPPFNNPAIRQALAMAVDQLALMRGIAGSDPSSAHASRSFFPKGSPFYSEAGSDVLAVASTEKAKQALTAAGYKGEKVVLLSASENPGKVLGAMITDTLKKAGFNVEMVTLDFASLIQRRTNHGPVDKGGWNLFTTGWTGGDTLNPAEHPMLRGAGLAGYAGWCDDPKLEALREQWALAPEGEQKAIAEQIQAQAFKSLPFIPLGGLPFMSAWRKTVTGVLKAPYGVYWNMQKSA
jgi:peptide/nickel transport system substrate-binding protein